MSKHDCWYRNGRCIFCDRVADPGQRHQLSMCRVQFGDGTGYVCPNICAGCRCSPPVMAHVDGGP